VASGHTLGVNRLPGHISNVVKWLLWDGSNLVKALLHQTTAIVASLATIPSVNPSLGISQGSKRNFSFPRSANRSAVSLAKRRLSGSIMLLILSQFLLDAFSVPVSCAFANLPISSRLRNSEKADQGCEISPQLAKSPRCRLCPRELSLRRVLRISRQVISRL
jgi:hypothetical protein